MVLGMDWWRRSYYWEEATTGRRVMWRIYYREEATTGRRVEELLQIFTDECAVTQFPGSSHP